MPILAVLGAIPIVVMALGVGITFMLLVTGGMKLATGALVWRAVTAGRWRCGENILDEGEFTISTERPSCKEAFLVAALAERCECLHQYSNRTVRITKSEFASLKTIMSPEEYLGETDEAVYSAMLEAKDGKGRLTSSAVEWAKWAKSGHLEEIRGRVALAIADFLGNLHESRWN